MLFFSEYTLDNPPHFLYNYQTYPGVAQLVARMVRVHAAVGSTSATRTMGESL